MIENNNINIFEQLRKVLSMCAVIIERLEINSMGDFRHAEQVLDNRSI